ncbi:MAG TPA: hypothetical protein VK925_03720 [Jiangellaceae bacterium]|nr:hypothetical protein [Jiangellaceae bacterium]
MTTHTAEQLVADYLARLDRAAATLPPDRRAELLHEIRDHIEVARAAGAAADEAAVRTMLDRLGEPDEIVTAAREAQAPDQPPPAAVPVRSGTGLELAAALLLTVGSFIPLLGWATGAILMWASRRWKTREKLVGTLVVPGGPGLIVVLAGLATMTTGGSCDATLRPTEDVETSSGGSAVREEYTTEVVCTSTGLSPWITVPLLIAAFVAPFVVAGILYSRARARAALEPSVTRPARPATGTSPWGGNEIAATLVLALGGIAVILFSFSIAMGAAAAVVGLVFVWASRRWTRREQKTATAIVGIVVALAAIAASIVALLVIRAGEDGSGLGALFMMPVAISMIAAAVYLAVALNRRQA